MYEFMQKHDMFAANLSNLATGPINTYFGHNCESCIDYFLIPNYLKSLVAECVTLDHEPLNTSDHNPVVCRLKLGIVERNITTFKRKSQLKWNGIDPTKLYNELTLPVGASIHELINRIKDCLY